jgi:hypothetical protein
MNDRAYADLARDVESAALALLDARRVAKGQPGRAELKPQTEKLTRVADGIRPKRSDEAAESNEEALFKKVQKSSEPKNWQRAVESWVPFMAAEQRAHGLVQARRAAIERTAQYGRMLETLLARFDDETCNRWLDERPELNRILHDLTEDQWGAAGLRDLARCARRLAKRAGVGANVIQQAPAMPCSAKGTLWSKPMSKADMGAALKLIQRRKLDSFLARHGLRQAGNRQLWQVCLDEMDERARKNLS